MSKAKGLLLVNTGPGKGKTTAALGVVFRALGHGMKCGVIQFIKGKWKTGEMKFAASIPKLSFHVMGLGFTWESEDLNRDKEAACEAWKKAAEMIRGGGRKIVVLDEITYAFHYNWLNVEEVLKVLRERPEGVHVILTGRQCPPQLLEAADLVTVMECRKHPFEKGIPAQIGVDF